MVRRKKSEFYSLVVMPPHGRASWRFRVHRMGVRVAIGVAFVCVCIVAGMAYFSVKTAMNLTDFGTLGTPQNAPAEIRKFKSELNRLKGDVEESLDREDALQDALNQAHRSHFRFHRRTRAEVLDRNYKQIFASDRPIEAKLSDALALLRGYIEDNTDQITAMETQFTKMKTRFAGTPSEWPIFGLIDSDFGWRIHPITRQRQFHKGIDIAAWAGSPVKATADGVVIKTGWNGGYGIEVVIDHGHGLSTIYAHNSRVLVLPGERVEKGTQVALVGSTGLSTGPHVHYEVQRWGEAIDPKPFLDVDMFTASKLVW